MPQISRIPFGYLDLVLAETGGRLPPNAQDNLTPTIELEELYQAQTLAFTNELLQHTNDGQALLTDVPDAETWILRGASVGTTLPLTTDFERWNLRLLRPARDSGIGSNPFPPIWTTRLMQVQAVGQSAQEGILFPKPIALVSGTRLQMIITERDASAARDTRIQYVINRLTR